MSVELVRGILDLRDDRLSAAERFVLLDYAEHANADTRRSWPSTTTVAAETGLGQSTVDRAMTKLRTLGYLAKVARQRVGEHAWVWVYEVNLDAEASAGDDTPERGIPRSGVRGHPRDADDDTPEWGSNRKEEPEENLLGVDELQPRRQRRRDPLFDAIVDECGIQLASMTASAKAGVGKVRRELAEVGATPDDVRARSAAYRRKFRGADLTPQALAKHWPTLAPPPEPPRSRDEWLLGYQ